MRYEVTADWIAAPVAVVRFRRGIAVWRTAQDRRVLSSRAALRALVVMRRGGLTVRAV